MVDDGIGFDPAQVNQGLGLQSVQERATLLNARYYIAPSLPTGTQVSIRIPVANQAELAY